MNPKGVGQMFQSDLRVLKGLARSSSDYVQHNSGPDGVWCGQHNSGSEGV